MAWLGNREVTQYQAIPVAVQASSSHPGGVIDFDRSYEGTELRARWGFEGLDVVAGLAVMRWGARSLPPVRGWRVAAGAFAS